MARRGAPEEQRFDFDLAATGEGAAQDRRARRARRVDAVPRARTARAASTSRPDSALAAESDDAVALALQRRVGEVAAVAHGERLARVERDDSRRALGPDGPAGDASGEEPEDEDDDAEDGESLTVAEFYERVKRALARAFDGEVWVTGEIRGLNERRGHHYIELADEGSEVVGRSAAQQLEVVCWAREWPPVAAALAQAGVSLEVGRVVRVRGRVSVWEGGSKLRFTLTALDVEALLGGIAAARHRLLLALERDGLLEANAMLPVPLVPLRIGVVTSPGSEAHRDFVGQLARSGFAFDVLLEPSLVQGPEAPRQVAAALARLARAAPDLVVVVRGGGARGDLAAFDSEDVARAIATAPFPVWTGIGHTGDRSVADEVAQRALITPTACGEAVVAAVAEYVDATMRRATTLASVARAQLDGARERLHAGAGALTRGARHQLDRRHDELVTRQSTATRAASAHVSRQLARLGAAATLLARSGERAAVSAEQQQQRYAQVLRAYDPVRQLERGWSLTRDSSGRLLRSASGVVPGTELVTRLADGEIVSGVHAVRERAPSPETSSPSAAPVAKKRSGEHT